MGTFGGDLLRILAHGVMGVGTSAGTELIKGWVNSPGKLQAIKEMFDQAGRATDPDQREALLQGAYDASGVKAPTIQRPSIQGFAPPGLEPSVATPNPYDTLLQTQSQPKALQELLGAVPVTKGESMPEVLKNRIASGEPTLESWRSKAVGDTMAQLGPIKTLQSLDRSGLSGNKMTDMQKYIEAVQSGDTATVAAIEKYHGGRNAVRAMFEEFKQNPNLVGSFYNATKPSDLTRTMDMPPSTAGKVGQNRTLMEPQVPILNTGGEKQGTTAKGSVVLPKPEATIQKAPSPEEQIMDVEKRIDILTKEFGEGTYKRPEAKEAIKTRIDELKVQRDELRSKLSGPIDISNFKGPGYYLIKGKKTAVKTQEEYQKLMGK